MNTDFRVNVAFHENPKVRRLVKELGPAGWWHLCCLWGFTARSRPTGELNDMEADEVEQAALWRGRRGKFVEVLVRHRLLDEVEGTYHVHDWGEHNAYAAAAPRRTERARKGAVARWERDANIDASSNVSSNALSNALSNAPAPPPAPSPSPNPSPAEAGEKAALSRMRLKGTGSAAEAWKLVLEVSRRHGREGWAQLPEGIQAALRTMGNGYSAVLGATKYDLPNLKGQFYEAFNGGGPG